MESLSISISTVALLVSVITFWLTRIRKGNIRMTKPSVIFFGPDGAGSNQNKIFVRTLLYNTSERGQYIENMYIRLQREEDVQNFTIWVYGEKDLVRGSGLFVNQNGIVVNHHFLMPKDGSSFEFKSGDYQLDIFVELVNKKPKKIYSQHLTIGAGEGRALRDRKAGIYFDWSPGIQTYQSHIDYKPEQIPNFIELIKRVNAHS